MLALTGELWAAELPGVSGWLGQMVHPWPVGAHDQWRSYQFEVALTDAQLQGLEKARAGGELHLRAQLTAVRLGAVDGWPARNHQEVITLSSEEWAKVLDSAAQGAAVTVLVPITEVEGRATAARRNHAAVLTELRLDQTVP
ncbi:hypothetical protein [Actinacidiphila soli]|uniref:hypothetical protein n=1 Tax=Actinacidiphila soli TaxID=2487275 RepID=UPI000FCAD30C|nr:hypothetical protein [Actinacidiphila soli]